MRKVVVLADAASDIEEAGDITSVLISSHSRPDFCRMGIRDRDYMKRRPNDDDGGSSKAEEIAERLLNKFPRLLMYCGIGVVILALIAFVVLKFSGMRH